MSKAIKKLSKVHKPFDFVESKKGSWGYIKEVSVKEFGVSYSVNWIKNVADERNSWWYHRDLNILGNMFKEIAKCAVHPFGGNEDLIDKIM